MPRRRKTAASSASRRPRARLPDGDQGKDLSLEQKQAKIQVLLKDYDFEIAARIKQMQEEAAKQLQQIENLTRMELLKTPKHILEMEIDDLIELNDNQDGLIVVQSINKKTVEDYASSLDAKVNALASQKPLDTISEESDDDPGTVVKKGKTGGRTSRRKGTLKATSGTTMMPPPSTARGTRRGTRLQEQQALQTPGYMGAPSAAGWETPLVTPRFDPRLPKTPAVLRNPKPGERTMTVSLAGSPLANRGQYNNKAADMGYTASVPLRNNKTLVVGEDTDLETIDLSDLGAEALQQIRILHQKLANVLQLDHGAQ